MFFLSGSLKVFKLYRFFTLTGCLFVCFFNYVEYFLTFVPITQHVQHLKRLFDGVTKELSKRSTNLMLMGLQIDLKLCGRSSSSFQVRVQFDVRMSNNHKRHSCLFEEPSISISHRRCAKSFHLNCTKFKHILYNFNKILI